MSYSGKAVIYARTLKHPRLPSRNSTQRLCCNLHRLVAIPDTFPRNTRLYHKDLARENDQGLKAIGDLVSSDAQRRTIYALSTPPGKAGVAVVRISGPDALNVWKKMVKPHSSAKVQKAHPEPWKLERCRVTDPNTEDVLDDGLAAFFKGGKTCQAGYGEPKDMQVLGHSLRKMS